MKVMAFNGSPRKDWNTGIMIKKALEGTKSKGAETELVHLYDLKFKGCISCFDCKKKDGKDYGRCSIKDGLKPILKKAAQADAFLFGSPIYLGSITGEMQSFIERLVFPYLTYADSPATLFPKKIKTGFIFTMGMPEEMMTQAGYGQRFANMERMLTRIFGAAETVYTCDTYQFDDYSKVVATRFDPVKKLKIRQEIFPKDCQKALEMGERLAKA